MGQHKDVYYRRLAVAEYAKKHPEESNVSIGKRFGISERSVRRYVLEAPKAEQQSIEEEIGITRKEKEHTVLKSKYTEALKLIEEKDEVIRQLMAMDGAPADVDIDVRQTAKREVTPVIVASDWHIEETVTSAITNGKNEYNLEIAEDSIKQFFTNACYLVNRAKQDATVNTVVLAVLGDIINGVLRAEDLESNQTTSIDALTLARTLLYNGIKQLAKSTGCLIKVVCCVGNHGRMTEKVHYSNQVHQSLEYLMYKTLERDFRDHKSVEFIVAEGPYRILNILGYDVRFQHGHSIRYSGGIGGISVPVLRKVAQWNTIEHADIEVIGHFHTMQSVGNVIVNGSLVGSNGYSMALGLPHENPSQAYFQIDSKYGKSMITPIFIDRKVSEPKNEVVRKRHRA